MKLIFVFIGDHDEDALGFIKTYEMQRAYKILLDRLETSYKRFNFQGIPTTIVIKKDKTIYKVLKGYNQRNISEIKNLKVR